MVGMSQRSRSIGNPRRRRLSPPLALRVVSPDSPGLVVVFLVACRSSSVARAAGPSVACGSRSLSERRARSQSSRSRPGGAGRGRAMAAAEGAAAARRSRGRPFCGRFSSAVVLWLTHKQCAFLGPGVAGAGEFERPSAHTTLKSFEFHAAGRGLSVCTRGDDDALEISTLGCDGFFGAFQRPRRAVLTNERPAYRVVGSRRTDPVPGKQRQLLSRVTQLVRPRYTHGRRTHRAEGISPVPRSQRAGGQPSRRAPPPNNQA